MSSDLSDPVDGQSWYNTSDDTLKLGTADGTVEIA
jgi:hypothetical protein